MSEIDRFDEAVGRSEERTDVLAPSRARAMLALLDRDPTGLEDGDLLPPGWHWIYFNPTAPRSDLGSDGHPERGGLVPPMPLPRRMWAGGRIQFPGELRLGTSAERHSKVASIVEKEGRTGRLIFVTVEHHILANGKAAVVEEQDLVYREAGTPDGGFRGPAPPGAAEWTEAVSPDPVTLFRFSALTFNGHRIHYDQPYATEVEGYPGLVVHGPLLALLLLDAGARRFGGRPTRFSYRAVSPLFCHEDFELAGRPVDSGNPEGPALLWAAHPERGVAMRAELEAEEPTP